MFLHLSSLPSLHDPLTTSERGECRSPILHTNYVVLQLNEAFELERARSKGFGGIGKQTKEEALLKAASIYAKLGYMKQYCDIMAELGDWSRALALAPVVSMEYWRQMAEKRAQILASEDDFSCVPLLVASGRAHEASDFLAGHGALEDAFCIAQVRGMESIRSIESSDHLVSPPVRTCTSKGQGMYNVHVLMHSYMHVFLSARA